MIDNTGKSNNMIRFSLFFIPVNVHVPFIRSRAIYTSLFPFFCFVFFSAKGIYPVYDRVQLILSFYMNLRIYVVRVSQKKPFTAYQMKRFEKEFCFLSTFCSLNLLKQKDIHIVIIARKRPKIVFITYSYYILSFSIICYSICT